MKNLDHLPHRTSRSKKFFRALSNLNLDAYKFLNSKCVQLQGLGQLFWPLGGSHQAASSLTVSENNIQTSFCCCHEVVFVVVFSVLCICIYI